MKKFEKVLDTAMRFLMALFMLALVLGALTETNLRQALIIDNNNFLAVLLHPISSVIIVIALLLAFGTPIKSWITTRFRKKTA